MATINCANCHTPLTPQQTGEPCPECGRIDRNASDRDQIVFAEKSATAKELARRHFEIEEGLTHVFRYSGAPEVEAIPAEPLKFLEVNAETVPTGVMPLQFGPVPESGISFPSIIIEVTPDE